MTQRTRWVAGTVLLVLCAARAGAEERVGLARIKADAPYNVPHPLLARELVRQAVLIAARDELGLATRDEVLGEPVRDAKTRTLVPDFDWTADVPHFALFRDGDDHPLVTADLDKPNWIDHPQDAIVVAERMSRETLPKALTGIGLTGKPDAVDAAGTLDAAAAAALERPELLTQISGLRLVHQQIAEHGESPQRLAALARGYANVWQLSWFVWGGSPKDFAARALLYGQRAVVKFPKDADALSGRAYALAMCGFPKPAIDDLDAAKGIRGGQEPWRDGLVRDLAGYDTGGLVAAADADKAHAGWAHLLAFLTVEHAHAQAALIGTAEAALMDNRDCQRLIASINDNSGPGLANWASEAGGEAFSHTVGQADKLPGFPQKVGQLIQQLRGGMPNPNGRMQVCAALHAEGDADTVEPSWHVLARTIEDVSFQNVVQRAYHIQHKWGIDPGEYLDSTAPLVAGHRYRAYLDVIRIANDRDQELYRQKLSAVRIDDPTFPMFAFDLWDGLPYESKLPSHGGWAGERNTADWAAFDTDYYICTYQLGEMLKGAVQDFARITDELGRIAPDDPMLAALKINADWMNAKSHADEWLKTIEDHPALTASLAHRYAEDGHTQKAIDMYERDIAVSPDYAAFKGLADLYWTAGKPDSYKATLDRALAAPDFGLQHANIQTELVNYLLQQNRPQEALPYAQKAAQTASWFGIDSLVRVNEALGRWDEAERGVIEIGEHYEQPLEWPLWCVRTGHGDQDAARKQALAYAGRLAGATDRESLTDRALALLVGGQTREAEQLADETCMRTNDPWAGLLAAGLAAERGDAATRDRLIDHVADPKNHFAMPDGTGRPQLTRLAAYLKRCRTEGRAMNPYRVRQLTENNVAEDAANTFYFAAKLAQAAGDPAAPWLFKQSAEQETRKVLRSLAVAESRAHPATTEPTPPPP